MPVAAFEAVDGIGLEAVGSKMMLDGRYRELRLSEPVGKIVCGPVVGKVTYGNVDNPDSAPDEAAAAAVAEGVVDGDPGVLSPVPVIGLVTPMAVVPVIVGVLPVTGGGVPEATVKEPEFVVAGEVPDPVAEIPAGGVDVDPVPESVGADTGIMAVPVVADTPVPGGIEGAELSVGDVKGRVEDETIPVGATVIPVSVPVVLPGGTAIGVVGAEDGSVDAVVVGIMIGGKELVEALPSGVVVGEEGGGG